MPSAGPSEEAHREEVKELLRKKQGRPLLMPDVLDHQMQEYVKDLRKRGLPINASLVVAAGEGIVMNKYAGSDGVEGSMFTLTTDWAISLC